MLFINRNVLRRSVDFASGGLNKTLHPISLCRLAHIECALDVGIHITIRSFIGVRNRDQRRQVKNGLNIFGKVKAEMRVTDVAAYHLHLIQIR